MKTRINSGQQATANEEATILKQFLDDVASYQINGFKRRQIAKLLNVTEKKVSQICQIYRDSRDQEWAEISTMLNYERNKNV